MVVIHGAMFMIGGLFTLTVIVVGGVDTGWTFYTPYSSTYANSYVLLAASGIFISGFSSIATALNFIVTIHLMRAPGLTRFRLPIFVWALYGTSLILLLATPILAVTLMLLAVERLFGVGIFDPAIGGNTQSRNANLVRFPRGRTDAGRAREQQLLVRGYRVDRN